MWETLRRYAPVAGFPRWITNDDGDTWEHQIPNCSMALLDPTVFPEPLEFILGRPGLNAQDWSRSINWADPAIVNNDTCHPDSHCCPGKELSQEIIIAFMQEFVAAGPWETDDTISINSLKASPFILRKTGSCSDEA